MDAIPMFVRGEFPNFRRLYANYTEEKLENSRIFEIDTSLFKLLRLVELCFQKVSSRKYIIQREQVPRSFFFSKVTQENDTNLTHSISLNSKSRFIFHEIYIISSIPWKKILRFYITITEEFLKKIPIHESNGNLERETWPRKESYYDFNK